MKTCTKCAAELPSRFFAVVNGSPLRRCNACINTARRLRDPLPALRPNPLQVRLNNTFNLWHHPVGNMPPRSIP